MFDDVTNWLEELGLGEYACVFAENNVDLEVLPELTDADLKELGVTLGHRRKMLKATRVFSQVPPAITAPPETAPADSTVPAITDSEFSLAAWERHPGERKPVTMLFADITGSTALTEKLDAEETHELLYGATRMMCEAVENNRGTVCRFMGDGVMAMFGAPVANEQHAVDACEAALEMQKIVGEYARDIEVDHGHDITIRVGLHSGEVVVLTVGEGETVEYDASGPTVPVAARMEQAAEPGRVYLTASTRSLAEARIETEALDAVSVKGISEPVPVFALRRVRAAEEESADTTRTLFVGRRGELSQFLSALDTCIESGQGQAIYVRGEPGIGKTRLVGEFRRIAASRGATCHRGLVLPFGVGRGQDAIRALLRSLLGITPGSGKGERGKAADAVMVGGRLEKDERVYLNDLLDLPQPTALRSLYDAMDNATRNSGKQAVVTKLVAGISRDQPLLVILEDVHWADPITLSHLAALTKVVADCPALIVMTSRIEGDPLDQTWRSSTQGSPLLTVDLGPLREQESIELIAEFMDSQDPLAKGCLARAAGNPLFLEQLMRNAREGLGESLPDSIQTLILARLDRLESDDKRALQAASVIGQRFDSDVLGHLLETSDYDCRELIGHNLVRPEGTGYLFAHALIQEGVYGSLLKRQRQALHKRCAECFAGSDSALHAEHLAHAGDPRAPIAYLEAAREQAGQYRFGRALGLTEKGLALADEQSDLHPLRCLQGELLHDLADVEASITVYRQALDQAEDDVQRCDAWLGLAAGMRLKTDYEAGLEFLDQAEAVATDHELTRQRSRLHHLRGNLYFPLGRVERCHEEHQLALDFARETGSVEDEARALGGLGDAEYARGRMRSAFESLRMCVERCRDNGLGRIEVANRSQMANCFGFLGTAHDALKGSLEAVEAAARVGHDRAEMNALAGAGEISGDMGDADLVAAHAQRGQALARKLRARAWDSHWLSHSAWAPYLRGQRKRAEEMLLRAAEDHAALTFTGAWTYGMLSMMTGDPEIRIQALQKGEALLEKGTMGANFLHFYRYAMEACLQAGEWGEAGRYAQALEDFTRQEPLPSCDFFISRGRALASAGRGDRQESTTQELRRVLEKAIQMGYNAWVPALEDALSSR